MFLIFFLLTKFCLLHLCASFFCSDRNNEDQLTLIHTFNEKQRLMNAEFINKCGDYYDINNVFVENKKVFANELVHQPNIINLYANGSEDQWIKHNLINAGHVFFDTNIETETCSTINRTKTRCKNIIKLVSQELEKHNEDLFDFITQMQFHEDKVMTRGSCATFLENPRYLRTILLCVDDQNANDRIAMYIRPLKLKVTTNCERFLLNPSLNNFLAVLTPKPIRLGTEYLTPTIFYKTPFLSLDVKGSFPNSINLFTPELLKYGFSEFIKAVGWYRVTIISDVEYQSTEFENQLVRILAENGITYHVLRCAGHCNINQIMNEVRAINARVAIANVDDNNARELFRMMHWLTWLVRGNPMIPTINEYSNVFTFTLGYDLQYPFQKFCAERLDNGALIGIQSIFQAYWDQYHLNINNKKEYYGALTTRIMRYTRRFRARINIYVRRKLTPWNSEDIMTLNVNDNNVQVVNFKNPYENKTKPNDGTEHCILRNYNFEEPCEDFLIIGLMLVLMTFTFSILMIVCYFHETAPINDPRYHIFR